MFPGNFVDSTPDKLAIVRPATGESITYAELDRLSTKLAHYLRDVGLGRGDNVAMVSNNDIRMLVIYWAALRSGMYITAINNHLTAEETNYILGDCGAVALFASPDVADAVSRSTEVATLTHRIAWGGELSGFESYDTILAQASDAPLDRSAARPGHALLIRHHGSAQGHQGPAAGRTGRRDPSTRTPPVFSRHLRFRPGLRVPVPGSAVSRCATTLLRHGQLGRRHCRADGPLRCRDRLAADRRIPGDPQSVGPDDVHPDAETARRRARRSTTSAA